MIMIFSNHYVKIEIVLTFGFGFNFMTPINSIDICWFNDGIMSLKFNFIMTNSHYHLWCMYEAIIPICVLSMLRFLYHMVIKP